MKGFVVKNWRKKRPGARWSTEADLEVNSKSPIQSHTPGVKLCHVSNAEVIESVYDFNNNWKIEELPLRLPTRQSFVSQENLGARNIRRGSQCTEHSIWLRWADPVQPHLHAKIINCRSQFITDCMRPEVAIGPQLELFPVNSALDIHLQ